MAHYGESKGAHPKADVGAGPMHNMTEEGEYDPAQMKPCGAHESPLERGSRIFRATESNEPFRGNKGGGS